MKKQLTSKVKLQRRPIGPKLKIIVGSWFHSAVDILQMLGNESGEGEGHVVGSDPLERLLDGCVSIGENIPSFNTIQGTSKRLISLNIDWLMPGSDRAASELELKMQQTTDKAEPKRLRIIDTSSLVEHKRASFWLVTTQSTLLHKRIMKDTASEHNWESFAMLQRQLTTLRENLNEQTQMDVMRCHVMMSWHVMSCRVMSCRVMCCDVM